jgi:hypothetical protein
LATSERQRRLTWGPFPKPMKGEVPYANSREELAGLCVGEKVRLVMETPAWAEVMQPVLDAIDAERPRKGPAPAYDSTELESCLLYARLVGAATYGQARMLLAGDRAERCRAALGFDHPRKRVGTGLRLVRSLDGVPSEATVWRHRRRFGMRRHLHAYRVLFERLVEEHFEEWPEQMREEARIVNWDGSMLLTHYTSFEREKRLPDGTMAVKPPTLIEGGCMPRKMDNSGKDGHGFCLVAGVTQSGLPLAARLAPIEGQNEGRVVRDILKEEWPRVVGRFQEDDLVRVMAADGAYSGSETRQAMHRAGYVPNCHPVSHSDREESRANAKKHDEARYKVSLTKDKKGRPRGELWKVNGHWELVCGCGQATTMRRATKRPDGEAVARLEAWCPECGHVSLTAGEWRIENKPHRGLRAIRKAIDAGEGERWAIGNPLTFNDPLSARYGSARFGHGEGFHGALVTRFGLLKEKSWHRQRKHAERDLLQVFCLMHALAKETRWQRKAREEADAAAAGGGGGGGGSGPPPPLALAA